MGHKTNCKIFLSRQIQIAANCCSNSTVFLPTATTTTATERESTHGRGSHFYKSWANFADKQRERQRERKSEREKSACESKNVERESNSKLKCFKCWDHEAFKKCCKQFAQNKTRGKEREMGRRRERTSQCSERERTRVNRKGAQWERGSLVMWACLCWLCKPIAAVRGRRCHRRRRRSADTAGK